MPYISHGILLTTLNTKNKAQQAWAMLRQVDKEIAVLRQFHYDIALSSSPSALPSLPEVAAPTHIIYGSDYPFAPPAAVTFLNHTYQDYPLDDSLRRATDHGNPEARFSRLRG